jgi:hypothetical protein
MNNVRQRVTNLGVNWEGTDLDPLRDELIDKRFPSVTTAREFVRGSAPTADATGCPCCGQHAKVYKRHITGAMACALIQIYKYYWLNKWPADWLHVPRYLAGQKLPASVKASWHGGDWSKLRFWKLIEPKADEERADGSLRVGYYRITDLGRGFVERQIEVPKFVFLYAQTTLGLALPYITIDDALGAKFNYTDLMGGI